MAPNPYNDAASRAHNVLFDENDEQTEMPEEAKVEINNLLFMLLPPATTLREMERIAVAWHYEIVQKWDEVKQAEKPKSIGPQNPPRSEASKGFG